MGVLDPYRDQLVAVYPASTGGGGTADLTATNALLTQIRDGDITANVDIADMEALLTEIRDKDYAAQAVTLLTAANASHVNAQNQRININTKLADIVTNTADSNTKLDDVVVSATATNALLTTLVDTQMPAQAILLQASNQLLTDTLAKLEKANGLIPDEYDDLDFTYVGTGLPAEGEIKTVLFKLGGVNLNTLTLNYNGDGVLSNVNSA